jgi:hypothetical protein
MDNIIIALGIIIFISLIGVAACYFFRLEKEKQIDMAQEWLLMAVVEAEKKLGGGTGQLKLRYVYDLFLSKFKFLAKVITFEQFSMLVDVGLAKMNDILQSNVQVQEYIDK